MTWLDPEMRVDNARVLPADYRAAELTAYRVSRAVNSSMAQEPGLDESVAA